MRGRRCATIEPAIRLQRTIAEGWYVSIELSEGITLTLSCVLLSERRSEVRNFLGRILRLLYTTSSGMTIVLCEDSSQELMCDVEYHALHYGAWWKSKIFLKEALRHLTTGIGYKISNSLHKRYMSGRFFTGFTTTPVSTLLFPAQPSCYQRIGLWFPANRPCSKSGPSYDSYFGARRAQLLNSLLIMAVPTEREVLLIHNSRPTTCSRLPASWWSNILLYCYRFRA